MTAHKILLADDSATIRKVVELTFADEGIEVVSVGDGDAAMKKFVEIEPDMVIADVNMPGMNGYRICEMIKADESTRHIPVILLVGSFEPFDPGEASRVGSNYYFTKPFQSIRELVEKVTEYLEHGAASETIAAETADIEDLYNESFQTTIEMPRPEKEAEEFAVETEDDGEEGVEDLVAVIPSEPETADGEIAGVTEETPADEHEFVDEDAAVDVEETTENEPEIAGQPAAEEPEEPTESEPEAMPAEDRHEPEAVAVAETSPWTTPVSASVVEKSEKQVFVAPELGDAGMDDEIIETSHPGEPAVIDLGGPTVNPFDERVNESAPETEKDRSMARYDWHGQSPDVTEEVKVPERSTAPLKFTIEDVEPEPAAVEDVHFDPREEPEPAAEPVVQAGVTPELIEMIVKSVLEKMSDRAVRDAAQEAVPRIAEKLIREALDDDNKN